MNASVDTERCLEYFGVKQFGGYQFCPGPWLAAQTEARSLGLEIRQSSLLNAGVGVFAMKRFIAGPSGQLLCSYAGEPMQEWIYDAIVTDSKEHYSGILFDVKFSSLSRGIWRGIECTLGASFNAAKHARQAQLELRMDLSKIDHKHRCFNAEGFMQIWLKADTVIEVGEELLLYYSKCFWQRLQQRQMEATEEHCVLCLLFHSTRCDPMFLCDHCGQGFHLQCLKQWLAADAPDANNSESSWYCHNCQVWIIAPATE